MHIIFCPSCGGCIEVESINCQIFRHAIYRDGSLYNPHATDQQIETDRDVLLGCGVQFQYNGVDQPVIYNESSP
jgi:hypothetical protein